MAGVAYKPTIADFIFAVKKGGIENVFDFIADYEEKDSHRREFKSAFELFKENDKFYTSNSKTDKKVEQARSFAKSISRLLEEKQKYITELEATMKELTNNLINNSIDNQECSSESRIQLEKEYSKLNEDYLKLQQDLEVNQTELREVRGRERSLAKLLYRLSKRGLPVEEMLEEEQSGKEKEFSTIKTESSSEVESSLFLPINIDSPKHTIKPAVIPSLDLQEIKNSYSSANRTKNAFKR